MNYLGIYNSLIERARFRQLKCYVEKHHVKPLCMGGDDSPENLVELTPEEHYVAHQLLVKLYPDNDLLAYAASMMTSNRPSNKLYGWVKRRMAEAVRRSRTGKKFSAEVRQKLSDLQRGKKRGKYKPKTEAQLQAIANSMLITDGKSTKRVDQSSQIPEGWKLGRHWIARKPNSARVVQ